MNRAFSLIVPVLLLAAAVGCGRSSPRAIPARSTRQAAKTDFASRLDAAKGISNTATKDATLAQLAVDAATAGDGAVSKSAVQAISNSAERDDAAYTSALRLAQTGKGEAANEVARLIGNSAKQDEVLAKIAKGDVNE